MAEYAANSYYLSIDGTNVSAYVVDISPGTTVEEVDITAGSGTTHRKRSAGLKDNSISFTIRHDTAAAWSLALVAPGVHAIVYGLEGNAVGKPEHAGNYLFTGAPHTTNVGKGFVTYTVSANASDAPTSDMFAGGTF